MRWRRIAFWSGLGLLAIVAVAISWLLLADLGTLKPHIERWASDKTGRQISINGELHIDLGRHSSLVAEDIRISNADWAEQSDMLAVGRIEVRLDLRAVLSDLLVVELVDLDDATIFLDKPEKGEPNWALLEPAAKKTKADNSDKMAVLFRQIDIDNLQLSYSAPRRAAPIEINVEHSSQRHGEDDLLDLSLLGTLNGRRIKLDGEIGTWDALLDRKNVQFDLGARIDTFTLSAAGHIDDLLKPRRPRIDFSASTPDINDLLSALGVMQKGDGPIDLVGTLAPQDQGPLLLSVAGRVGRLDVEAGGEFSDLQDLEEIDFDLMASGDDLRPILEALGIPQTRPSPFLINVDAARHGKTFVIENADLVFGQAKLGLSAHIPDFPEIDDTVLQLNLDGPDIERFRELFNLPGRATGPFTAGFTIDVADDGFELVHLDVHTSLGQIQVDGKLGDAPDYFGTTMTLQLKSESLFEIAAAYGIESLPDVPLSVHGSVDYGPEGIRSRAPLTVTATNLTAKIDGLIKPVTGLLGSDFEFEVDGPDLANLIGAFTANTGVPVQPYAVDGQLQIRDDGYRFRGVTGKLGTSDIEIDGLLVPRQGITGSRFQFAARGAAFTEVVAQLGEFQVRPGPYELSGKVNFEPDRIDFDQVKLNRATASVSMNLELGLPLARRWANLDIRASGPNVQFLLQGFSKFDIDEAPFMIDIEGKSRATTLSVDKLQARVGTATLAGQGTLDLDGDASSTQLSLSLDVPNAGELGMFNGDRMREDSLTLNANVTGGGGVLRIDDLLATLGQSDIKGGLEYHRGDIPYLAVDLESDSILFAPLLVEREEEYDPTPEFDDGRLIPDIDIPFAAMQKFNASIAIAVGYLRRDALHIRNVILRADLRDGILELSEAGFQAKSGAIKARARLDPNGGQGSASVEAVARNFALGMVKDNDDTSMTGDIDVKLTATGTNLRSLLGDASGTVFFDTRGGRRPNNRFMHALYGNMLDEIVGTINPFSKTETHTSFDCVIVPLKFDSGLVSTSPNVLVATNKVQMHIEPEIDLKSESLTINIRTTPKKGISFSAGEVLNPYLKIVGTLAAPHLAVDETGVLISGSAAVATAGLSVLARAAWTRLSRSKTPCEDTSRESIELLGDRFSDLAVSID